MAQKNAIYKVDNGSTFDEMMFKTIASQVTADGYGSVQDFMNIFSLTSKPGDGDYIIYKMPKGLQIHVSWNAVQMASGARHIDFAYAFPNACKGVITTCSYSLAGNNEPGYISNVSRTGFDLAIYNHASSGVDVAYYWIAIGY